MLPPLTNSVCQTAVASQKPPTPKPSGPERASAQHRLLHLGKRPVSSHLGRGLNPIVADQGVQDTDKRTIIQFGRRPRFQRCFVPFERQNNNFGPF